MVDVYLHQIAEGRYFLHEHPWSATSWQLECLMGLLRLLEVVEVRVDQCAYCLESKDSLGRGLALKPTRCVTNAPLLAHRLQARCSNILGTATLHRHVQVLCGRAREAAIYLPRMCQAFVKGILQQKQADRSGVVPVAKIYLDRLSRGEEGLLKQDSDKVHEADGAEMSILGDRSGLIDWYRSHPDELEAWDDVSGTALDPRRVVEARALEMDFFKRLGVYEKVPRSMARRLGKNVIGARWIDTNK